MIYDKNTSGLISKLESIIGSQYCNTNIIKGSKKKNIRCRFPVKYLKNKIEYEEKGELEYLSKQQMSSVVYKFGTHRLYIGDGLIGVLEELEIRYDLDFIELEKERDKKRKHLMLLLEKTIKKESEAEIDAGEYECGMDILEGKYTITSDEKANVRIIRSKKSKRKDKEIQIKNNSKETISLYKGDVLETNVMLLIRH